MESRNTVPRSVSKAQRPRTGGRGYCALCLELRKLEDSHIIPRTVVRQIQSLFPNKDLRWSASPNIPRQDIKTYPLLCRDCEHTLSSPRQSSGYTYLLHPWQIKQVSRASAAALADLRRPPDRQFTPCPLGQGVNCAAFHLL
jgi:hypothetical protein